MKITSLVFAGIGPYRTEQHIDFTDFTDDGIYLISGKTGAGKSTILDAICFALYNDAPRFDKVKARLRSDHCEPHEDSTVTLEFETRGHRYRLTRTPEFERPKKRGTGTTPQAATAELFVFQDGGWQGIAAKPREVGVKLDEIIGLGKDQFLQVILLAQNRFQKFLLATNEERQKVLRALFNSRRFEQVQTVLAEKRRVEGEKISAARSAIAQHASDAGRLAGAVDIPEDPGPDWFAALPGLLTVEGEAAHTAVVAADAEVAEAERAERVARETRARQDRLAKAAADREELLARREAFAEQREELAVARKADQVYPLLRSAAAAQAEHNKSATELRQTEEAFRAAFGKSPQAGVAEQLVGTLTERLGLLRDVLTAEQGLPELAAEVTAAQQRLDATATVIRTHEQQVEQLPELLEQVTEQLGEARVIAGRAADLKQQCAALASRQKAAAQLAEAVREQERAEVAVTKVSTAHAQASTTHEGLVRRKFAGYAAELAETLVDGAPCLVCGATEHPQPAPAHPDGRVTQEQIDQAWTAISRYAQQVDSANRALRVAGAKVAELRAESGDQEPGQLAQLLSDAQSELRAAQQAAVAATQLEQERAKVRAQQEAAAGRTLELNQRREQAHHALVEAEAARRSAAERVAAHLDGHPTAAHHAQAVKQGLAAARAYVDAAEKERATAAAHLSAQSTLAEHLAEQGFATEHDLRAAYRTSDQMRQLERVLNTYSNQVATVEAALNDPALQALPAELVDVAPAVEALRVARTQRDAAMRVQAALMERQRQLGDIIDRATTRHASYADQLERFKQLRILADTVNGGGPNTRYMDLETFVLAAQLEDVIAAANGRLRTMTSGRYTLEHDDDIAYRKSQSGLGLSIRDAYTGHARATNSLSGGETFLASLALALGLADVVTARSGGISLDTLFIDEGFGSLDPETLEIAMSTLDSLRAGGRTVGLISHVEVMKERIPARLRITVTERGDSVIEH